MYCQALAVATHGMLAAAPSPHILGLSSSPSLSLVISVNTTTIAATSCSSAPAYQKEHNSVYYMHASCQSTNAVMLAGTLTSTACHTPHAGASQQAVARWRQQLLQPWQEQHGQLPPALIKLLAGAPLCLGVAIDRHHTAAAAAAAWPAASSAYYTVLAVKL
jgi:hypothetical protein